MNVGFWGILGIFCLNSILLEICIFTWKKILESRVVGFYVFILITKLFNVYSEIFEVEILVLKKLKILCSYPLLDFINSISLIFWFSVTIKVCTYKTDSVFLSSIKFGSKIKVIKNF